MPIYEYVCLDCGARFDALRSMRDADSPIACQDCRSQHTSRSIAVRVACTGSASSAGAGYSASRGGGCAGCGGGSCSSCGH